MGAQGPPSLDFSVLGPLEVRRGGRLIPLGGPKPRSLLAALVLRAGAPATTDALTDAVWGEQPPQTAAKTLQKYVSQLRKELGTSLVTQGGGYELEASCAQIDACRFDALIDRASSLSPHRAASILEEALGLWRGEPFAELADHPDGVAERVRLDERRLDAIERLAEVELDLGGHTKLVGRLEELVVKHPLRERLWAVLMLALYRSGRQADALRAYQRLRSELAEVGIEPSTELRDLEDRILQQDPGLEVSTGGDGVGGNNLPVRLTSFIGRRREMEDLGRLLSRARLITLIGPGGSGKTSLAVECASRSLDEYPDGTWLADLAPSTSPDDVAKAVADRLGLSGRPDRPVESVLADFVAHRRLQILIDNCEHLVDPVAELVTRLLRAAPGLQVMATSRAPLGVDGEVTLEVRPLPVPEGTTVEDLASNDAARLFVERSQAVDPLFELTPENAAAVAEICRRLDGVPLALELAAARTRAFSPAEIAELLRDRFALLTSPVRTRPPRHRSLEAAVHWSYDLLSDEENTLFRRLSVFRGGFGLEPVRSVCAGRPIEKVAVVGLLEELVDRSLVVVDQTGSGRSRYRLLETLREYGRDRMNATETAEIRDAHAAYFCTLAERAAPQLRGPGQREWLARLVADHDNLRKALRWSFSQEKEVGIRLAIALADYWDSVGPLTEAHHWLGRGVELTNTCCDHLYVSVRLAASDLFVSIGLSRSVRYAEEALARAREEGDEASTASALRVLGWARALEEDPATAVAHSEEALRIWREIGDPWEVAWCLERYGQSEYNRPEEALRLFEESLALYREIGDRRRAAMVLYKMAEEGIRAGVPLDRAERWVDESIEIFEEMGSAHDAAHAFLELGKIRRRRGNAESAQRALTTGLDEMRKAGDRRCTARTLAALGIALIDTGELDEASEALSESLVIGKSLRERQNIRVGLGGMARVFLSRGNPGGASTLSSVADRIGREFGGRVSAGATQRRRKFQDELKSALGARNYEEARAAGQEISLDEAIDVALGASRPEAAD